MSNNGVEPVLQEDWSSIQVADSDEVGDSELSAPTTDDAANGSSVSTRATEQQPSLSSSDGDIGDPRRKKQFADKGPHAPNPSRYCPTSSSDSNVSPKNTPPPDFAHSFNMFKSASDSSEKLNKSKDCGNRSRANFRVKPSDLCSEFKSKISVSKASGLNAMADNNDADHKDVLKGRHDEKSSSDCSSSSNYSAFSDEEEQDNKPCNLDARGLPNYSLLSSRQHSEEGVVHDEVPMIVDTTEDYWTRLQSIRVTGNLLEYIGRGRNIRDNGLAQSCVPLTPLNHYFEIKIIDPGENCYIAIGVARKDYPFDQHPGWDRGSIAYHADDGHIFTGRGLGSPFGPKCVADDILGCGIIFPLKYSDPPTNSIETFRWPWELDEKPEERRIYTKAKLHARRRRYLARGPNAENIDPGSESEDDIWYNNPSQVYDDKVKVYFIRNEKLLGIKEVRIPKGGLFPTVGMLSANEKVTVELNPLSG